MAKRKRTRRGSTGRPTEAELEILEVFWELGPAAMGKIHGAMAERTGVGYTTTQKMVQVMRDKGLVTVDESKRPPLYSAADPPETTRLRMLDYLAQKAFGGSAMELVTSLVSNKRLSSGELDDLRKMIARAKKTGAKK